MGNRLRTTYFTRKVALVETDSKQNECLHLQFDAAEVGDVRFANVEPATTIIPGTDNLQEYNIVSYAMIGNKRYVRYNHDSWALEYVYNPEGYIKYWGKEEHYPYYYIKDHLGNVCAVWDSHANGYTQTTFYYPSGVPMSISTNQAVQPNKYNGKPYEEMHGFDIYEYEARGYYATIMRFTAMDPLCEQTPWQSPYVYAANNPVCNVDWMGLSGEAFQTSDQSLIASLLDYLAGGGILEDYDAEEEGWIDVSEESALNVTWMSLLFEFLFQSGPGYRQFDEDATFTKQFKNDYVVLLRPYINMLYDIYKGEKEGEFNHKMSDFYGLYGVPFFIKDIITIRTLGFLGNMSSTLIGSFNGTWELINDGKEIQISIRNRMSLESLLRLPIVGYWEVWEENIYPIIQSFDFRSTNQIVTWIVENPFYGQ